ncbi:TorD/DmsD family molecular chaperone [Bacillus marinisedimentorum]|uniref:TorD/DmsD family molecular chaperone n=1 Tax=Bacillus marinisedimentorum TaxID=1821260 RepID=UPI00087283A4|nr:molecular chaperone TorD family protein [Bacillus marinisedimentorum]
MQPALNTRQEALKELYLILAEFFKYPTKEFFEDLQGGTVEAEMNQWLEQAGIEHEPVKASLFPLTFTELKQMHIELFSGISTDPVLPVESIYKIWTADRTAEIPIAGEKGYLYGDSALHMRRLFDRYGLEIPDSYEAAPDHLTLLLEFLAYLIEINAGSGQILQYMDDHMDWLPDFQRALQNADESGPYVRIVTMLHNVAAIHRKHLEAV